MRKGNDRLSNYAEMNVLRFHGSLVMFSRVLVSFFVQYLLFLFSNFKHSIIFIANMI